MAWRKDSLKSPTCRDGAEPTWQDGVASTKNEQSKQHKRLSEAPPLGAVSDRELGGWVSPEARDTRHEAAGDRDLKRTDMNPGRVETSRNSNWHLQHLRIVGTWSALLNVCVTRSHCSDRLQSPDT